ncbi:hypothetical protein EDD68_12920 [Melghiribacillus thermohalophilus]|uniref:Permuted papain-like amidase YaeF/Yiix C92 family enzyme n=1 Tax=Melghiribacillus thermohalophilus TaxID=1324956 RepID=A0A4R3MQX6_9BACI|nr:hypothetical protein [Melghiribacillus thermohalophilus]TCT17550.1 hypothetical protein EDD68_12920 [Melghiribacillus thermohalophilus]
MFVKKKMMFLLITIFALFLGPISSYATTSEANGNVGPQYVPGPYYPGTNVEMEPGDVLVSPKNWSSTKFFGHVAIVGDDYYIYHSHPYEDGGVKDTVNEFMSRHGQGDTIEIYKPRKGASDAGVWAANNYDENSNYTLTNHDLGDIANNYCSKFVWQAFWFGAGFDLLNQGLTDEDSEIITPSEIENSDDLAYKGRFDADY